MGVKNLSIFCKKKSKTPNYGKTFIKSGCRTRDEEIEQVKQFKFNISFQENRSFFGFLMLTKLIKSPLSDIFDNILLINTAVATPLSHT